MPKRRQFLKTAAVVAVTATGALAIPNFILKKKKQKLGVALVGLGYYSTDLLAPALQLTRHCELKGIVTGSPWKIPQWQKRYGIPDGNVYNYQNMHTIADNPDIDVVYIVLPTSMHSEYSIIAANAGKHIWCEKPMARTEAECQAIIDACRKNKVKLTIGYRMQHEPNTRTVMTFAESRPFGKILSVTAEAGYYDGRSDHWKQKKEMGGGAMYDMGVYPLNATRYATGMEPIAVLSANHSTKRPEIYTEVDETTEFILQFPEGILARGATSLGKGFNKLQVDCANGWYNLQPMQSYNGVRGETSTGERLDKTIANQQASQMDNDAIAIKENQDVIVPGEEGMLDIRIVEAIYKSAATGSAIQL
ncbi:MAG: Gfo/Idh/MocA family oxidoreductase [Bacteroidota bacterium]